MHQKRNGHPVFVIGTSAGGLEALRRLVTVLPANFPAPILIVQHMESSTTGQVVVQVLSKAGAMPCKEAEDGEPIRPGHIYVAAPDHHMLISKGRLMISKGARENRWRPAIDPLFRSAAVAFGPRVMGVILTGNLNDGTAGMEAVRRCGGTCMVQDPNDALYPEMPQSVLKNMKVDQCLSIVAMGPALMKLADGPIPKALPIPKDIAMEAKIAERVASDVTALNVLGHQVPFNCPNCGGVLWQMKKGDLIRYRCHTGHSYSSAALEADQEMKIEETMWVSLRMLEERRNLLNTLADPKSPGYSKTAGERARESEVHIQRIRAILQADRDTAGAKTGKSA